MDSEKLNSWLTLIANFGVVIGIALLIYELRESQNLTETNAAVRRLDQIQEAMTEMAVSETLPAIRVKAMTEGIDSLNEVELYRLQMWELSVRHRMQSQYVEFKSGYLDGETAKGILKNSASLVPYWEELGIQLRNTDLDEAVREELDR